MHLTGLKRKIDPVEGNGARKDLAHTPRTKKRLAGIALRHPGLPI